jgi:hypothetical protein
MMDGRSDWDFKCNWIVGLGIEQSKVLTRIEEEQVVLYPLISAPAVICNPQPDFEAGHSSSSQFLFHPYPLFVAQIPPELPSRRLARKAQRAWGHFALDPARCVILLGARSCSLRVAASRRTCVRRGFYGSPKVDRIESVGSQSQGPALCGVVELLRVERSSRLECGRT